LSTFFGAVTDPTDLAVVGNDLRKVLRTGAKPGYSNNVQTNLIGRKLGNMYIYDIIITAGAQNNNIITARIKICTKIIEYKQNKYNDTA